MSFDVDIGHASDRGPRELNEDFAGAVRTPPERAAQGVIAAVADGVSTGGRGLVAAQTTVIALLDDFFATPQTWAATTAMDRLIGAQNTWLAQHNRGPGGAALTTLTAIAIQGQTWTVGHVGDTRAWLLRGGEGEAAELQRLTQDHAFDQPDQRSRLTRAVGLDDALRADFGEGEVRVGDLFLLTTDGVHGVLKPRQISQLLRGAADAQAASTALVQAAVAAGSRDNATALVLRVIGLDERSLRDELGAALRLPVPKALRVGDTLDGHVITAVVADSGVHRLYQARAAGGRALVALKTLHPARASDPEEHAMLAHEAWLGLRLADVPGFVRVHERAADASALYTVFDWHQGRTVEQLMAGGTRPAVTEVVDAAIAATRALGRLHRLGVVHRDIKPANLHRDDDGQWRILDLGVAVSGRESAAQRELHAGTPSYMNPEQWEDGGVADARSDLFALGATLYQWLAGRLPYGEIEPYQKSPRFKRDPAPVSRLRPDVPIWLDHVLRRAVARDPAERFETAEELLLALERGAARPLAAPPATPLLRRDEAALWKIALVVSLLFNMLLVVWLLFLPR